MKIKNLLIIICSFIIIVIGGLISRSGFYEINKAKESVDWPSSNGIIVSSEMGQDIAEDETIYSANIVYEFKVAKETIRGGRIKFGFVNTGKSDIRRWLNQYPKGKEVIVYYDPANPYESVLLTGENKTIWILPAFGIVFASFGVLVLLVGVLSRRDDNH